MWVYLLETAVVVLLWFLLRKTSFKWDRDNISGPNVYLLIVFVMFGMTMALRSPNVGTDTLLYTWIYGGIKSSNSFTEAVRISTVGTSFGYVFLQYVVSRLFRSIQWGIAINAIVIAVNFYYFIKNNSKDYRLSAFLFISLALFFEAMNGTRQFMAIGFCLNAYCLIKKNIRSKKGWLLFVIACSIHNTMVAFLLSFLGAYLLRKKNAIKEALGYSAVMSLALVIGFGIIIKIIINIFPYFSIYVNGQYVVQIMDGSGNGRILLVYVFLGIITYYSNFCICKNKKNLQSIDHTDLFVCNCCILLGVFFAKNVLFNRILWPFLCVFLIYFPNLFEMLETKNKRDVYFLTITVFAVYAFLFLIEDKSDIVPYIPFWSTN